MIYFYNSATTVPNEEVLNAFIEVNKRFYANPASLHKLGQEADSLLEKSRSQILTLLQVDKGHAFFTSGGTEANNLALLGYARKFKHRGRHVITTAIEHPSIIQAAQQLEAEGFEVEYLAVNHAGVISPEELEEKLREDTILVSIMHVNNETGAIQPIEKCGALIHQTSRAVFHVDAVQSYGKLPIFLTSKGPDALTISGHKIHGLKGTGALITKEHLPPSPISYGGGQEQGVRSGTVSVPNAVSLARAMRMADEKRKAQPFQNYREELIAHLQTFENVKIFGVHEGAPHILTIAFQHITGEVAVNYFQSQGIIVSTSSACSSKSKAASHVIGAMGISDDYKEGVIRISFGNDNTREDIVYFKKVFTNFIELLRRGNTNDFK